MTTGQASNGVDAGARRGHKSESAFRTISEVSADLNVPQHVLRFWETRFAAIQPMRRGGGRRYYRPEDVLLLRSIRDRLYGDGFTIKGVQKLLAEKGADAFVAGREPSPGEVSVAANPLSAEVREPGLPLDLPQASMPHRSTLPNGALSVGQKAEVEAAVRILEALKITLECAVTGGAEAV